MTVKSLRFYHEKGILNPSIIDPSSGYRYYHETDIAIAYSIKILRSFEFSISEIKEIIESCEDDSQVHNALRSKALDISSKIKKYQTMQLGIQEILANDEGDIMNIQHNKIIEKNVNDLLVLSIRVKTRYEETGKYIGKLYKAAGRHADGKVLNLYWDEGYVENDADLEICLPVKKVINKGDIKSRTLEGGRAVSIVHKGPYGTQGVSYKAVLDYMSTHNLSPIQAPREIFLKGPGMIFKGNPKNYLTEIIWIVGEKSELS